ncbi:MAG: zinc-binding dehydrogenase [Chloroflexi bacterium]|nr:zinc-binding dehydrogenase [Chloroflexota bacterium]
MNAILLPSYGGPEVLTYADVPDPTLRPGEALVRVRACGVTHFDLDIRAGVSRLPIRLPHVLGRDMAGDVVAVAGATQPAVGSRVVAPLHLTCMLATCPFCSTGRDNLCPQRVHPGVDTPGNYAELAVYPAASLLPLPEHLSYADAVAGLQTFATALHVLVTLLAVQPGETVLITGAAGGVGLAAVQVARLAGARVIAAAGADRKLDAVQRLGVAAGDCVNYATHDLAAEVRRRTDGRGIDAVMEIVGGEVFLAALDALAIDGRLGVTGAHGGEVVPINLVDLFRRQARLMGSSAYTHAEVRRALALMAAGTLRAPLGHSLPLAAAAEAHRLLAARANIGKIVLLP